MTTTDTKDTQFGSARSLYTQQRMLFMTLDPVHIGAGGYRLGRVDMTIAREPGTNLPKIPGTSLAGAARSYAAMRYGKPDVAGQHKHYAGSRITCPIIHTFGTATDTSPSGSVNQAGTVSVGDAHILFFPVHSMAGPVWVSTADKVREAWGQNSVTLPQEPTDDTVVTSMSWDKELNLGWLLFTATKGLTITPPNIGAWSAIADRVGLVTPKLFSQIVNSNLEVRTSVSIDPKTGAAESGALFTYEAIPRTTWLWSDVVEDDYRTNGDGTSAFHQTSKQCKIEQNEKGEKVYKENEGEPLGETWNRPLDVVKAGMKLIEYLGVGGMGTRGFGRMRLVGEWEASKGGVQ
jgi:CRISPR-associated protein Cmr4